MEQQNQAILSNKASGRIIACAFSREDLKTLCEKLQELSSEAAEEEIRHYIPANPQPEQMDADIQVLRSGFELKVTVGGADDEMIFGTISDVFNSPRFPDKVKRLYIDSAFDLRDRYNWDPRNRFELLLDFTKPEIFNPSLSPSLSTPNASNISVILLMLHLLKILFDYARWIFPIVEYKEVKDTAQKHRIFLYALLLAVFGNFLYDVIKIIASLIF